MEKLRASVIKIRARFDHLGHAFGRYSAVHCRKSVKKQQPAHGIRTTLPDGGLSRLAKGKPLKNKCQSEDWHLAV
ncbi:hypothetical protein [Aeromonas salmonicida]|uniref:hypothetical protein n=1 Tax=Aeromonas salmonicida TaxID=645 RepID=UPI00223FDFB1|nr:hypothetical protein [Aeromonas salmonicida]HDX8380738.1 hypothetical protein [Aeromonas salmonicida]